MNRTFASTGGCQRRYFQGQWTACSGWVRAESYAFSVTASTAADSNAWNGNDQQASLSAYGLVHVVHSLRPD
jgi:hypothetical protein